MLPKAHKTAVGTISYLQGGFREAGLSPFNPDAFTTCTITGSSGDSAQTETPSQMRGEFVAVGTIRSCTSETPIQVELRGYFCKFLKPSEKQKPQRRQRIQLQCTGEVSTSDEVLDRMEKADSDKAAQKERKGHARGKATTTKSSSVIADSPASEAEDPGAHCQKQYT